MPSVLYLADHGSSAFEAGRTTVDVVCAGDSITGWNNFGFVKEWPYRTYPEFLQRLFDPLGLTVANGGIAGEVSRTDRSGPGLPGLFPNAWYFVVGYGTNDLGMWPQVERTSPMIIGNLDQIVRAIWDDGRSRSCSTCLMRMSRCSPGVAEELHTNRDYHNDGLRAYCLENQVPLVDIASKLRDEHFADELHPNDEGAQVIARRSSGC